MCAHEHINCASDTGACCSKEFQILTTATSIAVGWRCSETWSKASIHKKGRGYIQSCRHQQSQRLSMATCHLPQTYSIRH
eukprot:14435561-Alexandrium_andersonii.AAC.1